MTREIALTKGYVALVDDEDFAELSRHSWHAQVVQSGDAYPARTVGKRPNKITLFMHQQVLGIRPPQIGDHKDLNSLNNTRGNLRVTDKGGNSMNRIKTKRPCSSQYKGVCWDKDRGLWQAYIKIAGKRRHLGRHSSEDVAALAYNDNARELFGEFAHLNEVAA